MSLWIYLLLVVYGFFLSFIFAFSLVQLSLTINYVKASKKGRPIKRTPTSDTELPKVCVQLPIYNEKYVVERLLKAVVNLDYPSDKLSIQVLDDSNDESSELIRAFIDSDLNIYKNISLIQRKEREGFKAGALKYGLTKSDADFIAIFDADFEPNPDFLRRSIREFEDANVACVQTRWSHLNEDENVLTKAQAFALDAHFRIEQVGRNSGGHFINFNGTAGVWRKAAILDSGGWQSDTLTEDLDLSYRAQMKGWKMIYMEELNSPAELPMVLSALRTQQHRGNKGAAECARKHLSKVLRNPKISWKTKVQASFHLLNSAVFISVLMLTVLSVPLLWVKTQIPAVSSYLNFASFFILSFGVLALFFWLPFKKHWEGSVLGQESSFLRTRWEFLKRFLSFVAVSMSFALFNSVAVISGYAGIKTPFIRTPKFNATSVRPTENDYNIQKLPMVFYFELLLLLYFLFAGIYGIIQLEFGLLPMHLLLIFGFGILVKYGWQERGGLVPN